jgi:hypothetical protein
VGARGADLALIDLAAGVAEMLAEAEAGRSRET